MHPRILHFVVFGAVVVSSCAANTTEPSELTSTGALIQALKGQGVTVARVESLPRSSYPFFSVNAQRIVVQGEDVQVFEYPTVARVDTDASKVSPSGTPVGQTQISWMDTPHFYKRDRLIVLYVGHAAEILKPLEAILGPPFAAGR